MSKDDTRLGVSAHVTGKLTDSLPSSCGFDSRPPPYVIMFEHFATIQLQKLLLFLTVFLTQFMTF